MLNLILLKFKEKWIKNRVKYPHPPQKTMKKEQA